MSARFVLDESSWRLAWERRDRLPEAVDALATRVETAAERSEVVARHADFYEADLGGGMQLYAMLFEADCLLQLERDSAERLRLAIDRTAVFLDDELESYDVSIGGVARFAPGAAWAHRRLRDGHAVAVLPLSLEDELQGEQTVLVSALALVVCFVTTESHHRRFFRMAISIEDAGPEEFAAIAPSAFPALRWVTDVWDGLRRHRRHFFGQHRDTLVRHLGVLDDDGAALFSAHPVSSNVSKSGRGPTREESRRVTAVERMSPERSAVTACPSSG
jgi:hypothetical protein